RHDRPGRWLRGAAHVRHVRVAGARARLRPRRHPVGRGRRLDQRHAREQQAHRATGEAAQRRPGPDRRDGPRGATVKLAAASATDQGRVRSNNEDAFLIDDQRALFAVADGMGGHRGGEVASHTAIEALRAAVANGTPLHDAITRANTAVLTRAAGDDELAGMGTTMTAVVAIGGRQLLIGHVGDSRAYMLHEGTLRRATEDHSLVEELVREGRLTPEQAEAHPQRAIVTRALGVDDPVDVDLYTLDVEAGDRVVLCSDGLTTMVRERDIERLARAEPDPQRLAQALVAAATAPGGGD